MQSPHDEETQNKKKELLKSLLSMGFDKIQCYKAIAEVDITRKDAADRCVEWIQNNAPSASANSEATREALAAPLLKMGFSRSIDLLTFAPACLPVCAVWHVFTSCLYLLSS